MWDILVQLNSLNNVYGFRFQVSGVSKQMTEGKNRLPFVCCPLYLPDT
jgi:hypothetical protein